MPEKISFFFFFLILTLVYTCLDLPWFTWVTLFTHISEIQIKWVGSVVEGGGGKWGTGQSGIQCKCERAHQHFTSVPIYKDPFFTLLFTGTMTTLPQVKYFAGCPIPGQFTQTTVMVKYWLITGTCVNGAHVRIHCYFSRLLCE